MAPHAPNNSSFSLLLYFCFLVSFIISANALSFRLIYRDSVHSPLFPGRNLSDTEILQRGIEISQARMSYLQWKITKATNMSIHPDGMTPRIGNQKFLFLVEVSFGTPPKPQNLIMDTGSDVTWIQCEPCHPCFPQKEKVFDPTKSSTYRKIPCNHPLCRGHGFSCSGNDCVYTVRYATPSTTKGVFSFETISALSSSGNTQIVPNIAFGCSNYNTGFKHENENKITGLMGLGVGPTSMLSLLGPSARGRFSYCLQGFRSPLNSYLRFGSDAFINGHYQVTPLMSIKNQGTYYLYLNDISIGRQRMAFPLGLFAAQRDGSGGTIIDSGCAVSYMHPDAYKKIRDVLVHHFAQYNLAQYRGRTEGMDLCYVYKPNMKDYPSMTFHLKDADLVVLGENVFFISPQEGYFCLAILPATDRMTVLGAWQQHNTRFLYDAANSHLIFAAEDCSKNP